MADNNHITAYRQQLRERIVDTAMRAFAARGIRAVKMDDLAHLLGISKRTLYELYNNKEDLLYAGVEKYRAIQERKMLDNEANCENVIDAVIYSYRLKVEEFKLTNPQFYSDLQRYPRVMAMLEASREVNRVRLLKFLTRGVKEGYFRDDVDYDIVLFLFDAIGQQVMARQLYRRFAIEELFYNMVFTSIRGFCTQLGVAVLDDRLKG